MNRGPKQYTAVYWKCSCDCGKEFWSRSSLLNAGRTTSCGCLRRERFEKYAMNGGRSKRPLGERTIWALFSTYSAGAERRGIPFDMSFDMFKEVTSSECFYCGACPTEEYGPFRRKGESGVKLMGIDRVDNSVGYTDDSVVPCCTICNLMKRDLTVDEFVGRAAVIAARFLDRKPDSVAA